VLVTSPLDDKFGVDVPKSIVKSQEGDCSTTQHI
jgi:hypothetical protein